MSDSNAPKFLEESPVAVFEQGANDLVGCVTTFAPLVNDVYEAIKAVSKKDASSCKKAMENFADHFQKFQSDCLDKLSK
jgi:hypothetical protein